MAEADQEDALARRAPPMLDASEADADADDADAETEDDRLALTAAADADETDALLMVSFDRSVSRKELTRRWRSR